ncbi:cytoskeleton protein RodZ [Aliivibrio kagoshimensis]|uniref:cytoskeleton protein RodZ n=1 Tax=Aliivibrio kagoshimensis TaxID=2910230 RepID=UPI003D0B859E
MTKEEIETTNDEVTSSSNELLPGDILKEAREKMGFSISEIADRLRLRSAIIQKIEDNEFELGKSATFTRGYLRSYAKVVGVEERNVLAALDKIGEAQVEEHEMQSFSRQTKRAKHDSNIMKLTWVILALFIGITMMWWWQNQAQEESYVPQIETAENQQALASTELVAPVQNTIEEDTASSEESIQDQQSAIEPVIDSPNPVQAPVDETAVAAEAVADVQIEEPATVVPEKLESETPKVEESKPAVTIAEAQSISMRFSDDCWIDVKDATGKNLSTGVKKAGSSLTLQGVEPFKVVIGAPSAVELSYQGKPVDLTKFPVGKVARLTLQQ